MSLKVWMTPTLNEAAGDTTNAINQIVLRLGKYLPEFGFELVENPDNADLYVSHAGQGSSVPVDVAIYHGLYPTGMGMDGVYFAINSHVIHNLRTAKAVIAPSEWIADVLRRDMHISPHVISWGVDTDEWQPASGAHVYVLWNKARVDFVSDPAPMLELASRAPNVPFLTTFGQGGPNVKTIGRQPYPVMKDHVRNAGLYLSTNVETFGLGILEAMASGVPILGFRQGAIAEYLTHGYDSFLAEPGDMDGLLKGLNYVLQHREILGRNARQTAMRFSWREMARKTARVFENVMQPHTGAKVSVVIPCHNYGHYVGEAIESVLAQEADFEYEIIVVLDRCTDGSAGVVAKYPVKTIIADNGNLSATRNDGIQTATGEYIVLLDADDRLGSPRFIQTLAEALDADRTLGIAFTGIQIIDAEGNLGHQNPWPNGYDFDLQAQRKNQVPSCCMFRKEAWRRAGGFKTWFRYAEDAEFWLQVGSIGYRAKHVVRDGWFQYRLHNSSASKVHRTGEIPEPDWTEFYPWTKDGQRPFAADGKAPFGSWPVRFYNRPDVSIIIPVGPGHEEAVKNALHSVEGQTYRFWECIVVNDTSKPLDLTGYPWAKIIRAGGGEGGAGYARNVGAKYANAPLLVFLDADDLLKPRFLEATLRAFRRNGKYAYTDWLTDDRRGKMEVHQTPDYSLQAFREHSSLHPVTALVPKAWFDTVGGFDESMQAYEDVDFYFKMLTYGFCGVRVAEPLLIYNLDSGKRRAAAVQQKDRYATLLKSRYREFMEKNQMCDCIDPPKGLSPAAPTPENAAQYRETYGEMVKVQYVSPFAPVSPVTLRGPATRVPYGARAKGDIFYVWQADLENSDGVFERVEDYVPPPAVETVMPPPPEDTAWASAVSVEIPNVDYQPPADSWYSQDGQIWQNDARPGESIDSDPNPNLTGQYIVDEDKNIVAQARSIGGGTALDDMTVNQLKSYAKKHNINLRKAKNRDAILAVIQGHEKSRAS